MLAAAAVLAAAAPGDPDPGFDVDGRRAFGYGGDDRATDVALLPDGRVVVAGWTTVNADMAVTRLTRRGAFDAAFGEGGTSDVDVGGDDRANAVAVQPDGKVVVAGRTLARGGDMAVLRLRADGSLDRGFGRGGIRTLGTSSGDAAYDVAVQPDGRIVVVGDGGPRADIAVARLERDGSDDLGFGARGRARVDLGEIELGSAVALQPDGRIVVAGATTRDDDIVVARLRRDGSRDRGFGRRGATTIDAGGAESANAVAVQPDGMIVVAGSTSSGGDMIVARLRRDGSLDAGFDGDGLRRVDFGGEDIAFDVALQRDGKIIVAGRAAREENMAVARLQPGGALDTTFDRDGRLAVDFAGGKDTALGLVLQPDGRIVLAGSSDIQVAVARLEGDPPTAAAPRCAGRPATIVGTPRRDILRGTPRADVIAGLGGGDAIRGLGGADILCGGRGPDLIDGGRGADRLFGGAGVDECLGGPGRDRGSCERRRGV